MLPEDFQIYLQPSNQNTNPHNGIEPYVGPSVVSKPDIEQKDFIQEKNSFISNDLYGTPKEETPQNSSSEVVIKGVSVLICDGNDQTDGNSVRKNYDQKEEEEEEEEQEQEKEQEQEQERTKEDNISVRIKQRPNRLSSCHSDAVTLVTRNSDNSDAVTRRTPPPSYEEALEHLQLMKKQTEREGGGGGGGRGGGEGREEPWKGDRGGGRGKSPERDGRGLGNLRKPTSNSRRKRHMSTGSEYLLDKDNTSSYLNGPAIYHSMHTIDSHSNNNRYHEIHDNSNQDNIYPSNNRYNNNNHGSRPRIRNDNYNDKTDIYSNGFSSVDDPPSYTRSTRTRSLGRNPHHDRGEEATNQNYDRGERSTNHIRWSNSHLGTTVSSDRFPMNGRYDNDVRCNRLLEDFRALRSQVEATSVGHSFPRTCHEKHFVISHDFKAGMVHSRPKSWASALDRQQYLV